MKSKKMKNYLELFFILLFFFLFLYFVQKNKADLRRNIRNSTAFSIGTVIHYASGSKGISVGLFRVSPSDPSIRITFSTSGGEVETNSKGLLSSKMQGCEGKKYVVIYDSIKPENCILLFDYPVKDSSDFAKYLEQFKTNPPDLGD